MTEFYQIDKEKNLQKTNAEKEIDLKIDWNKHSISEKKKDEKSFDYEERCKELGLTEKNYEEFQKSEYFEYYNSQ
jgi:hypothetical protein